VQMNTIFETLFDSALLDPRLEWMNPPSRWAVDVKESVLVVEPDTETDFWQRTHYGFRADNGSFLHLTLEGDFRMHTRVRLQPRHRYDQAGLMVRISPDCWIKTSVEHETEQPSVVGAVVTNFAYSDWSTQEFHGEAVEFQITRTGADYVVQWREAGSRWLQLRMCHLHEDHSRSPVLGGLYACCPKRSGFVAKFEHLTVHTGAGA